MRELIQLIHLSGPTERGPLDLLLAFAAFADDRGVVEGFTLEDLSHVTRQSKAMVWRNFCKLRSEGWAWNFAARGRDQNSMYVVDIPLICRRALVRGYGHIHRDWIDQTLGIVPFPVASEYKEALRK